MDQLLKPHVDVARDVFKYLGRNSMFGDHIVELKPGLLLKVKRHLTGPVLDDVTDKVRLTLWHSGVLEGPLIEEPPYIAPPRGIMTIECDGMIHVMANLMYILEFANNTVQDPVTKRWQQPSA